MELTKTERQAAGQLARLMNGPPLKRRREFFTTKELEAMSATRLRAVAKKYEIPHRLWCVERVAFHDQPKERQISLLREAIEVHQNNKVHSDRAKEKTSLQEAFVRFLCYGRDY